MITPFIAFLFSICTWGIAYTLQKKQPQYSVRIGRKTYTRFQKTERARVVNIGASASGYCADIELNNGKSIQLPADDNLLNHGSIPFDVYLFANEYSPNGYVFPPPAIRYHDVSLGEQDANKAFSLAWSQIEAINQLRLVLFTTAFVVSFQAPHISSTISLVALALAVYFVKPISIYTFAAFCGIIKTRKSSDNGTETPIQGKENPRSSSATPVAKVSTPPPDVASDVEQYIHEINMRMERAPVTSVPNTQSFAPPSPSFNPVNDVPVVDDKETIDEPEVELHINDAEEKNSATDEEELDDPEAPEEVAFLDIGSLNQGDDPFATSTDSPSGTSVDFYSDEDTVFSSDVEEVPQPELDADEKKVTTEEAAPVEQPVVPNSSRGKNPKEANARYKKNSGNRSPRSKLKSMTVLEAIQQ